MKINITHNKNLIIKIVVILFIILMLVLVFFKYKKDTNPDIIMQEQKTQLFNTLNKNSTVNVSKYIIYGTHLNIEGTLDLKKVSGISINYVNLVLKDLHGEELKIDTTYNYSDETISFSSIDKLNSGINLEDLNIGNYYLLLKVTLSNSDVNYYSLKNDSTYGALTYYTLTKNNSNNKIDINFDQYNEIPYLSIQVAQALSLPENVYDIAIDPGHGGKDKGAISGGNNESNLVLDCALKLKTQLENLGLKVFITRDGTESPDKFTDFNMYDENGRITSINKSNAKLMISIHMDTNSNSKNAGGVEVYAPNDCNLDFASLLAKNIVEQSGSNYSSSNLYKKSDGVYVHNFSNADIVAYTNKAKKSNYEPYSITTSTPYLYMIREIGGICTNAFVDGRNKQFATNKYYNSNVGIEGYLIQLGSINNEKDLNNVLTNIDGYVNGILSTLQKYYNL